MAGRRTHLQKMISNIPWEVDNFQGILEATKYVLLNKAQR